MPEKLTFTVIKADCGSIGGHTRPTDRMLAAGEDHIAAAPWVVDHLVTYTGDDIAIVTTHRQGSSASLVHTSCRAAFDTASAIASEEGC